MPRTVVGGWTTFPMERAVTAGILAGTPFGAGVATILAGGNPYIGLFLLLCGAVLILTAFTAAEAYRQVPPLEGREPNA